MSKTKVLLAVAALALVATAASAEPLRTYNQLGNLAEGQLYINVDPRPFSESAVDLPTTTGASGNKAGKASGEVLRPASVSGVSCRKELSRAAQFLQ